MPLGLGLGYGAGAAAESIDQIMQRRLVARDLQQQQARDLARTDLQKQGLALDRQALLDRNAATVADEAHRTRLYGLTEREIAQAAEAAEADAARDAAAAEREQQRIDLERQRVDLSKLTESRLAAGAGRAAEEAQAARARANLQTIQSNRAAGDAEQAELGRQADIDYAAATGLDPRTQQPLPPDVLADVRRDQLGIRAITRSETSFPSIQGLGLEAGPSAGAAAPMTQQAAGLREAAIQALQEAGQPVVEANIQEVMRQLSGATP